MRIAEVAFPVPLPKGFHYRGPDGMTVAAGTRVRAPFGPRVALVCVIVEFALGTALLWRVRLAPAKRRAG